MFINTTLFYIIYIIGITISILTYNIVLQKYQDPAVSMDNIQEIIDYFHSERYTDMVLYITSILIVYGAIVAYLINAFITISYMVYKHCTKKRKHVFNQITNKWDYISEKIDTTSEYIDNSLEYKEIRLQTPTYKSPSHSSLKVSQFIEAKVDYKPNISVFYLIHSSNSGKTSNIITNIQHYTQTNQIVVKPHIILYDYQLSDLPHDNSNIQHFNRIFLSKSDYDTCSIFYTNINNPTKIKNIILTAYDKLVIASNNEQLQDIQYNKNSFQNCSRYFTQYLKTSITEYITFINDESYLDIQSLKNGINACVDKSFVVGRRIIRPKLNPIMKTPDTEELSKNRFQSWYSKLICRMESIEYDINYCGDNGSELIRGFLFYDPSSIIWRLNSLISFRHNDIYLSRRDIINNDEVIPVKTNNNSYVYLSKFDELDMLYQCVISGLKYTYCENLRFYTESSMGVGDWIIHRYSSCCLWIQAIKCHFFQVVNCCSKLSFVDRLLYIISFIYGEILYYVSSQALPLVGLSIYLQIFQSSMNMILLVVISYSTIPLQLIILYMFNKLDEELRHVKSYHYERTAVDYIMYVLLFPFYNQIQFFVIIFAHLRMVSFG